MKKLPPPEKRCAKTNKNGDPCSSSVTYLWKIDGEGPQRICGSHIHHIRKAGHMVTLVSDWQGNPLPASSGDDLNIR